MSGFFQNAGASIRNPDLKRLAIFTSLAHDHPSTFVHSHFTGLRDAFEVTPFYGNLDWSLSGADGHYVWPRLRYLGAAGRCLVPHADHIVFSWLLARRLRQTSTNVVLAEFGPVGAALVEATQQADVPLFVFFRGYDITNREVLEAYADGYRRLFEHAAGLIGVSRPIVERLQAMGAPTEKLYFNPSGIDPDRFRGAEPQIRPPHFLAVGRMVEKKAPYLTVAAFELVAKACPDARLTIVGDGPLLGPTKRMASALGLESYVKFLGGQSHETVSELMRQSRAFVQHSLEAENGDSEGTPNAIMEAQMSGLPVIATTHGGIPDVVIDGETGFLVPEGAVLDMGNRILKLACDPELAGAMGRRGREHALAHFTLDRHIRALTGIIDQGIAHHKRLNRRRRTNFIARSEAASPTPVGRNRNR